jgi:predicted nucleic acid-binding protein
LPGEVVVDASIALEWILREPTSDAARRLRDTWFEGGFRTIAPLLISSELANALHQRVRRSQFTPVEAAAALLIVCSEVELVTNPLMAADAIEIASEFGLPAVYDAHYIALARIRECEFWTADRRLWSVAHQREPRLQLLGT